MAKKNVENVINMKKDNGNTAMAEVMKNGKVDVTITTPNNVNVIRHFENVGAMNNEMKAMGYSAV